MEENKSNINILVEHVKEYAEARVDLLKIDAADRVSSAASSIASMLILMITGMFFLLFASAGCAWLIKYYTGNAAIGFFSVAGFYLLVSIIIYAKRDTLIKIPVVNAILKHLTDDK
ncbi:MAG: phage holin family protein [Bacteroidota bacterium]